MNWLRISHLIFRNIVILRIMRFTKNLVIPGFDGIPLYDIAKFFFRGIWKGSITFRASALSFTFFLALFPALLFFFTLIPYIPIEGFQETLMIMLQNILPPDTYAGAMETIEDIITRENSNLLSFGFFAALYFSTNGISGIMSAFNESVHVGETRSFIKQKIVAIILVIILSILIIAAISLIVAGTWLLEYAVREHYLQTGFTYWALVVVKWIIIIALFFFIISFMYYLAPARRERYRFISAGSTLATMLFILTSMGFNYYISNFSQYNKLYGSIGTLIIILMWIYFNAIVLLIGFELNVSIQNARRTKNLIK